jgi:uncharacterized membrane-anchored protein
MKSLRVVVLAQLAFFIAWAGWEEWKVAGVETVILETMPVDPRDLLSGQYMALRYSISNPLPASGKMYRNQAVGVRLVPSGTREVGGKNWTIWRAADCRIPPPAVQEKQDPSRGIWVTGLLNNGTLQYGIERYYFSENKVEEFRHLHSGQVLVEASVGRNGRLVVKRLIY